jgi:hypothetical protein
MHLGVYYPSLVLAIVLQCIKMYIMVGYCGIAMGIPYVGLYSSKSLFLLVSNMETDRFGLVGVRDGSSFIGTGFPMPWLSACERCDWAVVCQMNDWDCDKTQEEMEGE